MRHVIIGQPIDLSSYFGRESDREVLAELTKRFLKEIAHLAKDDTFEPQLAGKRWHPDDFGSSDAAVNDGSETDNSSAAGDGPEAHHSSEKGKGDDEPRPAAAQL